MVKNFEELPQNTKDFILNLRSVFENRFPNSRCTVKASFSLSPAIFIYFYLAKNEDECVNQIIDNDVCSMVWCSFDIDKDGNLNDKISFERIRGTGIRRKAHKDDPKEKFLVYSIIPVKFRKITNSPEKVISTFQKHVNEIASTIVDNSEEIQEVVGTLYNVKSKVNFQ